MLRSLLLSVSTAALFILPISAQDQDSDKSLDVRSSVGDLHVGKDADASKAGLPVYPGARPQNKENNDPVNLALSIDNFGMKLIVAKYESDDPAEKVLAFYRDKMRKYGKVLECHSTNEKADFHSDDDKNGSKALKCEGDNTGPVRELKVGTEDNARIVAIQDPQGSKRTTFSIVYLRKHEKGEI
jgi:hypothetical protein